MTGTEASNVVRSTSVADIPWRPQRKRDASSNAVLLGLLSTRVEQQLAISKAMSKHLDGLMSHARGVENLILAALENIACRSEDDTAQKRAKHGEGSVSTTTKTQSRRSADTGQGTASDSEYAVLTMHQKTMKKSRKSPRSSATPADRGQSTILLQPQPPLPQQQPQPQLHPQASNASADGLLATLLPAPLRSSLPYASSSIYTSNAGGGDSSPGLLHAGTAFPLHHLPQLPQVTSAVTSADRTVAAAADCATADLPYSVPEMLAVRTHLQLTVSANPELSTLHQLQHLECLQSERTVSKQTCGFDRSPHAPSLGGSPCGLSVTAATASFAANITAQTSDVLRAEELPMTQMKATSHGLPPLADSWNKDASYRAIAGAAQGTSPALPVQNCKCKGTFSTCALCCKVRAGYSPFARAFASYITNMGSRDASGQLLAVQQQRPAAGSFWLRHVTPTQLLAHRFDVMLPGNGNQTVVGGGGSIDRNDAKTLDAGCCGRSSEDSDDPSSWAAAAAAAGADRPISGNIAVRYGQQLPGTARRCLTATVPSDSGSGSGSIGGCDGEWVPAAFARSGSSDASSVPAMPAVASLSLSPSGPALSQFDDPIC